jgi:hypothetical protein
MELRKGFGIISLAIIKEIFFDSSRVEWRLNSYPLYDTLTSIYVGPTLQVTKPPVYYLSIRSHSAQKSYHLSPPLDRFNHLIQPPDMNPSIPC